MLGSRKAASFLLFPTSLLTAPSTSLRFAPGAALFESDFSQRCGGPRTPAEVNGKSRHRAPRKCRPFSCAWFHATPLPEQCLPHPLPLLDDAIQLGLQSPSRRGSGFAGVLPVYGIHVAGSSARQHCEHVRRLGIILQWLRGTDGQKGD